MLLIFTQDGLCVQKRPPKGLLANFWEFPALDGHPSPEEILQSLAGQGYVHPEIISPLDSARHVFTHIVWHMQGWHIRVGAVPDGMETVGLEALRALPFPSALRFYREIAEELLAQPHGIW